MPQTPIRTEMATMPVAVSQPETIAAPPPNGVQNPAAKAEPIIDAVRFADVPLEEALRLFSRQTGVNILPSPEAAGIRISLDLHSVTPTVALDTLARNYRLVVNQDERSGVTHLYTVKEYQEMTSRPGFRAQLQSLLFSLEKELNKAFPESTIRLSLVGEQVLVQGEAKDSLEAGHILRTVAQSIPPPTKDSRPQNVNLSLGQTSLLPNRSELQVGTAGPASNVLEELLSSLPPNIVNLLVIPGEQQVMLCVTVAEVSRSAARSIGLNFSLSNDAGTKVFQNLTGGLLTSGGAATANLPTMLDNG
jgi:type II secretory pathway component GspD/PulD (secretin)